MAFSDREKQQMCDLKGVGATVVGRLEQLGFSQLSQLADESASDITRAIAQLMGSSCWHNSPQARAAISAIIELAQRQRDL
ncbi:MULTISPECIES: hypothetical protein [Shewanella]|nr:hypothetical protein [Shewanella algae]AYV11608.1 hypothetical protein EEY24_01125 [Shewanella algae]MBO2554479.1 helix-hairpin-helix domain-containing protein [Shewanella algae]MBO2580029.1 helix-hairpin-helix domain-containing protein [Shewanella algae]MBO2588653.1 helix-hairpin-helix domain-containing protein [Shewanella algae]MBO2592931.1 helix-hairpin-helix domain-containing protein [Shewanella algae]